MGVRTVEPFVSTPAAIAMPVAIQTWVDDVANHGGAAILFGSRADGQARPDSDWDIAVVGDAGLVADIPYGSFDRMEVQVFHLTVSEFEKQQNVYPGIAYEVAHNGVLLAGGSLTQDIMQRKGMQTTDVKKLSGEFGRFVGGAFDYAWQFIACVEDSQFWDRFAGEWGHYDVQARRLLPERSADCAEFAVKALCLAAGGDYAWGHDMHALAEKVPESLRDRVRALNGHTRNDHMAGYGGGVSHPHDLYHRVVNTMDLLADMAEWKCPLLTEGADLLLYELDVIKRKAAALNETRSDEPIIRAFNAATGAWRARALEITQEQASAP